MRELDYFSQNYQVARKKFLDAAFASGASVDSVKNPHPGPDNQPLFMDVALKLAIPQMLPNAEVTAVSLEFGTVPPMQVLKVLRGENWLHNNGGQKHRRARQLKTCLLRAFHPNSEEWEALVWRQGVQVVERAMTSLAR